MLGATKAECVICQDPEASTLAAGKGPITLRARPASPSTRRLATGNNRLGLADTQTVAGVIGAPQRIIADGRGSPSIQIFGSLNNLPVLLAPRDSWVLGHHIAPTLGRKKTTVLLHYRLSGW